MNTAASSVATPRSAPASARWARRLAEVVSPATRVTLDAPLARRTTLGVGGRADVLIEPAHEADLAAVLRFCQARDLPWRVLGRGSNLLIRDGGVREWLIHLSAPAFGRVEARDGRLWCGAGARVPALAAAAARHGLAGLEFLAGIPGSVGGALRMNAGAHGSAVFDVLERVRGYDRSGRAREWDPGALGARYRECAFFREHLAVAAVFAGRPEAPEAVRKRQDALRARRRRAQPREPSAGCVFKNPPGGFAGKLIEDLGLKGARVGGAQVSPRHGNFIVNLGHATAADVEALIMRVRNRARDAAGVNLELEIEILGQSADPTPCAAP